METTSEEPARRALGWFKRASTARVVAVVAVLSVLGSGTLCFSAYAALGIALPRGTVGLVMILAPLLTPALVAPAVALPMTRQSRATVRLLAELESTRNELVGEIERRERLQAELEHQARRDSLTGLLNRRGFFEAAGRRVPEEGALVVVVDVDGLKEINDTHGHAAGDAVLGAVGEAIVRAAGPSARVGRLGGDEFVVLLGGDEERAAAVARALGALTAVLPDGTEAVVSASVGTARADGLAGVDAAVVRADEAMYEMKAARGRDGRLPLRSAARDLTSRLAQRGERPVGVGVHADLALDDREDPPVGPDHKRPPLDR